MTSIKKLRRKVVKLKRKQALASRQLHAAQNRLKRVWKR